MAIAITLFCRLVWMAGSRQGVDEIGPLSRAPRTAVSSSGTEGLIEIIFFLVLVDFSTCRYTV